MQTRKLSPEKKIELIHEKIFAKKYRSYCITINKRNSSTRIIVG